MRRWFVFTLLIPREFGDAISNFLIEQGTTGIEELDEGLEWKRLRSYILQNGKERRVLRSLHQYLKSLQNLFPEISRTQIEATSIVEQDWSGSWKKFFKPVQLTSRLVIKPPWSQIRLKKGQVSIDITPGMAFGTGIHATTKLSLQALEKRLRKRNLSVLDVGTGSGILSIAGAKLGAREVWGLDIDRVAVKVARENVRGNRLDDIVKIRKRRIGEIRRRFDLVVANIDLRYLRKMRWPLIRHLKSRGFLILSGILEEEREKFLQHYLETGNFQWVKVTQEEEWLCFTFKKK